MPEGPGLTVDEIFNVEQGIYLCKQSAALGWLNLLPGTSQEAYRVENGYNPDHPPLGRWWLGFHHQLTWWVAPPFQPDGIFVIACARTGSATAFALTLLLIGGIATAWSGRFVGVMTAISLTLMPRIYGHAHLASLETITNLTCTAAVVSVAAWWCGPVPPTRRASLFTGLLLGLALLTKIQAVLIPIPIICWALWRWKKKAVVPLVMWGVAAIIVFVSGWPYLWSDLVGHIGEYLGRTTNRATIQVWYFGEKYADKNVPWHYPFVMFALTVPAILHLLGILGLLARPESELDASPDAAKRLQGFAERHSRDFLLLGCTLFPLVVFSLPGVAVYDCERLFLTSFPLWAIFVGRGWVVLWRGLRRQTNVRFAAAAIWSILLVFEAMPLVSNAPFHLCYYNSLFQLRPSAIDAVGLEVDYWGVGVTRRLLQRTIDVVPEGSDVAIIPTLHPFQADDYRRQSPILRSRGIKTVENREGPASPMFALVYHRHADLPPFIGEQMAAVKPAESTRLQDLWLAYLVRLRD